MSKKELGDKGERIACEYLVKNGYKILARNYRIKMGEIDIIAKKRWQFFHRDRTIHFIEVKTLAGSSGDFYPEDRAGYKKQRKLIGLCEIWLEKNKFPLDHPYQIDVVGIALKNDQSISLHHFENVADNSHLTS